MVQLQTGLILLFAGIVIVYILANQQNIKKLDLALLVVSVVALMWKYFTYKHVLENGTVENFAEEKASTLNKLLKELKPIIAEEDISEIMEDMVMYFTSFNKLSFTQDTKTWRNMIETKTNSDGELECSSVMNFDLMPSFGRPHGFALGPNRLVGPLSNTLKINYRNPYTVMLVFKHGNLKNDATEGKKIELVKLWANSPNNNGLSLYIEPGSLQVTNNTQFGKLMFQYADYAPVHCRINAKDELIAIENNVLCFVFVVKYEDKVRLLYMTEKDSTINVLAEFNISNTDVTFSNKELVINRFKNWPAHAYNFAIYNKAISDARVSGVYSHIKALYSRYTDPSLPGLVDQYNSTVDTLQKMLQCPFDKNTCDACKDVTQWTDLTELVNAPLTCRKAISKYCKKNPTKPFCQCWDKKNTLYGTNACRMLRTMFETNDATCFKGDEIEKMKSRYEGKCKTGKKDTMPTGDNVVFDDDYTFDKIRVRYGDSYLTTEEKIALGIPVNKSASVMSLKDNSASLIDKSKVVTTPKAPSNTTATATAAAAVEKKETTPPGPKASNEDAETKALIDEVVTLTKDNKTDTSDNNSWSIVKWFGF